MDDTRRIAEADELERLADSMLEAFDGNALPPEEILQIFLQRLRGGVFSSLRTAGLIKKDTPFPDSFAELTDRVQDHVSIESGVPHRALVALATAGCLEDAIDRGRFAEAILWAMQVGAKFTHKAPTHSFARIKWTDFEPISGPLPELEDMSPSSRAGRLALIIQQGREIWGEDGTIEDWKVSQARQLKVCRTHVFQEVERRGNDWKATEYASAENPMELLCSQIDSALILGAARKHSRSFPPLDQRISDAEIYALYAILWAFSGLSELWDLECGLQRLGRENTVWVDHYLAEAEGFIRVALKFQGIQSASEAVNESNRKRADAAYETRYGAAIKLAREIAADQWDEEREQGEYITKIGAVARNILRIFSADLANVGLASLPKEGLVRDWIGDLAPEEARRPGRGDKTPLRQ